MVKKKKETNLKKRAGLVIIFISLIALIITFYSGGIWILNVDFFATSKQTNGDIMGGGFNAEIVDVKDIDADKEFANTYFQSLTLLSNSISFGTTWLEVCEFGQIEIAGEIYVQVCSDEYSSTNDIVESLKDYVSTEYIEELMGDNFIDKDGNLYIKPAYVAKDNNYIEFVSYRVAQKTPNKIIYMVKSRYGTLDCGNECNYSYDEHKFTLIRERNKWVVSNFEMPY